VVSACPDIGLSLKPLQLGVDVQGGSEAMGHVLCSALDANAKRVVVQIDFKTAFNSVFRATLVVAVTQHHPQLLPLVSWVNGQLSNLWV
jgi:hypothetical protein